ncbi:MAG: dTMP kinase [Candidatus Kapabacteria bacterium]|jgi:dTMP kinase|nr:dTMP kinase [Candidatus Kapabacteria bacterium]
MFITFEGIDGCGKTTQIKLLAEYLDQKGIKNVMLREPGGVKISEEIRTLLLDAHEKIEPITELMLFSAARAQLVETLLKPKLAAGISVLCDRFYDSTTAYQGFGRGLDVAMIDNINKAATGGLEPDLTIFLDISVAESKNRTCRQIADRIEQSGDNFFERVRAGFIALSEKYPNRVKRINVEGEDVESVRNQIVVVVNKYLCEHANA